MDADNTPLGPDVETTEKISEIETAIRADLDRRLRIIEAQFGLSTSRREVAPRKGHPAGCRCLMCRKERMA